MGLTTPRSKFSKSLCSRLKVKVNRYIFSWLLWYRVMQPNQKLLPTQQTQILDWRKRISHFIWQSTPYVTAWLFIFSFPPVRRKRTLWFSQGGAGIWLLSRNFCKGAEAFLHCCWAELWAHAGSGTSAVWSRFARQIKQCRKKLTLKQVLQILPTLSSRDLWAGNAASGSVEIYKHWTPFSLIPVQRITTWKARSRLFPVPQSRFWEEKEHSSWFRPQLAKVVKASACWKIRAELVVTKHLHSDTGDIPAHALPKTTFC